MRGISGKCQGPLGGQVMTEPTMSFKLGVPVLPTLPHWEAEVDT